jgi:hypothetical protein
MVRSIKYLLPVVDMYSTIGGTCSIGTFKLGFSGSLPFFYGGGALAFAPGGLDFSSSAFFNSSNFFSSSYFFNASSSSFFYLSSVSF